MAFFSNHCRSFIHECFTHCGKDEMAEYMTSLLLTPGNKRGTFAWERWLFCSIEEREGQGFIPLFAGHGRAISLPCLILWGSQSANIALGPLLPTKRPLSPDNSCAGYDFCMALGVSFDVQWLCERSTNHSASSLYGFVRWGEETKNRGSWIGKCCCQLVSPTQLLT